VVTDDPEVTNRVIRATNRQTEVKAEAFESLTAFHRTLEEFYSAFGKDPLKRLYYERRSKQYQSLPISERTIVSLAMQCKAFDLPYGWWAREPLTPSRLFHRG
jgi:hypothetical protein